MKILFSGDSFCEGTELDGLEHDMDQRDRLRYSNVVKEYLNDLFGLEVTFDNIGYSGYSNDEITRDTVEYCEKNEVDVAVVQFSHPQRWSYYSELNERWFSMDQYEHFYGCHPEHKVIEICEWWDANVKSRTLYIDNFYKNVFLLEQYFKTKNIPYVFLQLEEWTPKEIESCNTVWKELVEHKHVKGVTPSQEEFCNRDYYVGETDSICPTWWMEDEELMREYRTLDQRDEKTEFATGDEEDTHRWLGGWHPGKNGHIAIAKWIIQEMTSDEKLQHLFPGI